MKRMKDETAVHVEWLIPGGAAEGARMYRTKKALRCLPYQEIQSPREFNCLMENDKLNAKQDSKRFLHVQVCSNNIFLRSVIKNL